MARSYWRAFGGHLTIHYEVDDILSRTCVMCEGELHSPTNIYIGLHVTKRGYSGKDVTVHPGCIFDFQCWDKIEYDPDDYTLFRPVSKLGRVDSNCRFDSTKIIKQLRFCLGEFDPEQSNDAVLAKDARGVVALGIYDDPLLLWEAIAENSEDPLHQDVLSYFGWD